MMLGVDALTAIDPRASFYLLGCAAETAVSAAGAWGTAGLTVRTVRGRRMRTAGDLFDEFSAAWQFPDYFGENFDAFDECIGDLDQWQPHTGYVTLVLDAGDVLTGEGPVGGRPPLSVLIESLGAARAAFAEAIATGNGWDRPALAFHVVLHAGRRGRRGAASARARLEGGPPTHTR